MADTQMAAAFVAAGYQLPSPPETTAEKLDKLMAVSRNRWICSCRPENNATSSMGAPGVNRSRISSRSVCQILFGRRSSAGSHFPQTGDIFAKICGNRLVVEGKRLMLRRPARAV